jgi:hypothetical protein
MMDREEIIQVLSDKMHLILLRMDQVKTRDHAIERGYSYFADYLGISGLCYELSNLNEEYSHLFLIKNLITESEEDALMLYIMHVNNK